MFHTDFRDYRKMTCRFPNEGGFLGSPSLPTLLAALDERGRTAAVGSHVWQAHDNSVESWTNGATDAILPAWIGKDLLAMTPEDACYWLGLVQAEALGEYIANFHRRMFRQCGAAVFWMYNDCWPTTRGWTIVDHGLRRTPAFHAVRRAMAPVTVVVAAEVGRVAAFGINETPTAMEADLRFGRFALAGGFPHDERHRVRLEPGAVTELASFPLAAWTDQRGELAFAELRQEGRLLARHRLIMPRHQELAWAPATPQITLADGMATCTSTTFAWGVCLDLDGEMPLADNIFDLYPGIPYVIPWPHAEPPRIRRLGNLLA
jgi:beta-mannosidase